MASKADGEYAAFVPLGSECTQYTLSVSTASASITVTPGLYKAWLGGGNPAISVFCKIGGAASIASTGSYAANVFGFPGGTVEVIHIKQGDTALHAILTSSTDTLYLVKLR